MENEGGAVAEGTYSRLGPAAPAKASRWITRSSLLFFKILANMEHKVFQRTLYLPYQLKKCVRIYSNVEESYFGSYSRSTSVPLKAWLCISFKPLFWRFLTRADNTHRTQTELNSLSHHHHNPCCFHHSFNMPVHLKLNKNCPFKTPTTFWKWLLKLFFPHLRCEGNIEMWIIISC